MLRACLAPSCDSLTFKGQLTVRIRLHCLKSTFLCLNTSPILTNCTSGSCPPTHLVDTQFLEKMHPVLFRLSKGLFDFEHHATINFCHGILINMRYTTFSDFMPISTAAKKNFKSCDIWRQINFSNQIKPEALTTEECALNVVTEQKGGGLFKKRKKKWLGFLFFLFFCIAYDAVENWKPERKRFQRMNLFKSFGSPFFWCLFQQSIPPLNSKDCYVFRIMTETLKQF